MDFASRNQNRDILNPRFSSVFFFLLSLVCCLKAMLFITTARLCTVLGHAWITLKIPCLRNDSCPPAENMLLIFMCGLCYDEKYIAEFIFICLSSKSEPRQWDAWLMNTLGWESIRIYTPPSHIKSVWMSSKPLTQKLAFTLNALYVFVHMFCIDSLKHVKYRITCNDHFSILCGGGSSNNDQMGYNSK